MAASNHTPRQANEGLHQLGQALRNMDCFDEEDVAIWHDQVARAEEVDPELIALQQHLPKRQQLLCDLDEQFGLSKYYPIMMKKFAMKDAELQNILDEKLRNKRDMRFA